MTDDTTAASPCSATSTDSGDFAPSALTQGTMTAAEYVALAKRAAAWREERARSYGDPWDLYVYGPDDFEIAGDGICGPSTSKTPLMRAALSDAPADEGALTRALLRSAIHRLTVEIDAVAPGWRAKRLLRAELRDEIDALEHAEAPR